MKPSARGQLCAKKLTHGADEPDGTGIRHRDFILASGAAVATAAAGALGLATRLYHFINIFVGKNFHRYLLNSVIVAGTTTFLCLLFGAVAAFALARLVG